MKRAVTAAIFTVLILAGCNGSQGEQEVSNPTATPAATTLPATPTPSPVVQAECPKPTACPGPTACPPAPTCPEPITCPTCPTCPETDTYPKCLACPQAVPCPDCPQAVPCPDCPTPSRQSELCTSYKMGIELDTILLEIAEAGKLVGMTADEVRASLQENQRNFDQYCGGVALVQPSLATINCVTAGKWWGTEDTSVLYTSSAQNQVWGNGFHSIVEKYCFSQ